METIIKYLDTNTILHEIRVDEDNERLYKDDIEISSLLHHYITDLIENLGDLELFTFINDDYHCIFTDESNKDDFQNYLELLNKAISFIYRIDIVQYKNKDISCNALLEKYGQYATINNYAKENIVFYNAFDNSKIVEFHNFNQSYNLVNYEIELIYDAMIYSLSKFSEWGKNNEKE